MNISRTKFIVFFLISAFVFISGTGALLDQPAESFLGSTTQSPWQSAVSTILSPVKILLIGALVPFIQFLQQDPDTPPPFFLVGFAVYWTILALVVHYFLKKKKLPA